VLLGRLAGMSLSDARSLPLADLRDWIDAAVDLQQRLESS